MGDDDDRCEASPTGEHDFALTDVLVRADGADQVSTCSYCGVPAYEASAADDLRRPPL